MELVGEIISNMEFNGNVWKCVDFVVEVRLNLDELCGFVHGNLREIEMSLMLSLQTK